MRSQAELIEAITWLSMMALGSDAMCDTAAAMASALSWAAGETGRPEISGLAESFERLHLRSQSIVDQFAAQVRDDILGED
jgi:hypothetical protein